MQELLRTRPLVGALAFQAAVVVLALGLVWLFGLEPWQHMEWSWQALLWSLAATAPLAAMLVALPFHAVHWRWARDITHLIEGFLLPLFHRAPAGSVVLVAILAGVGEELLFRGVIQDGLAGPMGPVPALIIASVLFGLAHAVSTAYFIIASLMGLYLGWIYLHTGNLLIPIIVHALYDWIAIRYYLRRGRGRLAESH